VACGCGGAGGAVPGATLLSGKLDPAFSPAPPPSDSGTASASAGTDLLPAAGGSSKVVEVGLILAFLVALAWAVKSSRRKGE
jgi:hypothetical protein